MPFGSSSSACGFMCLICSSVISRWSRPSRAIGWCCAPGCAAPRRRPCRCWGSRAPPGTAPAAPRTSLSLARSTVTSVDSLPTSRPGDVEAVLGQQRVEVVAGNSARDVRVCRLDLVRVLVAERAQLAVDARLLVAAALDRGVLLVAGRAAPEPGAVVEQHLEGARCCPRPCRCAARSRRRSCCRSSRRACSSCGWRAPGRSAGRAARAASLSTSSTIPGSTMQVRASASTSRTRWQYLDQSMTTAVLVHWPARLVPPPRDSSGTPCARQTATAATAASTVRGSTTPIGTWRKLERVGGVGAAGAGVEPDLAVDRRGQVSLQLAEVRGAAASEVGCHVSDRHAAALPGRAAVMRNFVLC